MGKEMLPSSLPSITSHSVSLLSVPFTSFTVERPKGVGTNDPADTGAGI